MWHKNIKNKFTNKMILFNIVKFIFVRVWCDGRHDIYAHDIALKNIIKSFQENVNYGHH